MPPLLSQNLKTEGQFNLNTPQLRVGVQKSSLFQRLAPYKDYHSISLNYYIQLFYLKYL